MIEKRHMNRDDETLGEAMCIFPTEGRGKGAGRGYADGRSGGPLHSKYEESVHSIDKEGEYQHLGRYVYSDGMVTPKISHFVALAAV